MQRQLGYKGWMTIALVLLGSLAQYAGAQVSPLATRSNVPQEGGQAGMPGNPLDPMLQIYFVDVEGGQATLFISPDEYSLLIDTGWPGNNGRDADRIVALAKQAGLKRIDTVLLTHYHDDHAGGVQQLVDKFPVGMFIDHGPNREVDSPATQHNYDAYQKVLATGRYKHITASAGQQLPIPGFDATVITADGKVIDKPLSGAAQPNTFCASSPAHPADQTENGRSLGILIRYGNFKVLDLGDLTWDRELELMCPVNRLGHVDLLVVSHHGASSSSSPALVGAILPSVAIMDNGAKKGGAPQTVDTVRAIPGLQALWQLHYAEDGGPAHNTAGKYIANLHQAAKDCSDSAHYLRVSVDKSGSFDVFNSRTDESVEYAAKK